MSTCDCGGRRGDAPPHQHDPVTGRCPNTPVHPEELLVVVTNPPGPEWQFVEPENRDDHGDGKRCDATWPQETD